MTPCNTVHKHQLKFRRNHFHRLFWQWVQLHNRKKLVVRRMLTFLLYSYWFPHWILSSCQYFQNKQVIQHFSQTPIDISEKLFSPINFSVSSSPQQQKLLLNVNLFKKNIESNKIALTRSSVELIIASSISAFARSNLCLSSCILHH